MRFECDLPPALSPSRVAPTASERTDPQRYPQGVASGGPTPDGIILWTRLAPGNASDADDLVVEVAPDDGGWSPGAGLAAPSYRGRVDAPDVSTDYTVRVRLDGRLAPDSAYRYRFVHDGVASPVGRCRTLPAPDTSPASVSFAVLACQDYGNGYYGALGRVAREDVDYLLHLGDFIYEAVDDRYRGLGKNTYQDRQLTLPSGEPVASTLADFRGLYRAYRGDALAREAAAAHTAVRTWDDHAVSDNRYWDYAVDAPVLPGHPRGNDPEFARQLTAEAIQAFYEYTPARIEYDPDAERLHDAFRLYRSLQFGDLLELFVTDERLFRDPPPCRDTLLPGWGPLCPERTAPDRSMLGDEQRTWLCDGLMGASTRWVGWANEVLSLPLRLGVGPLAVQPLVDSWDGYPAERERVFAALRDADGAAATLTGDLHSTVVGNQWLDGTCVGIEVMTPAVTSVNVAEAVNLDEGLRGRLTRPLLARAVEAANPHIDRFDSHAWGYSVATFERDRLTVDVYAVDKTVNAANAPRSRLAQVERARTDLL